MHKVLSPSHSSTRNSVYFRCPVLGVWRRLRLLLALQLMRRPVLHDDSEFHGPVYSAAALFAPLFPRFSLRPLLP
jgi:hypothetical protein